MPDPNLVKLPRKSLIKMINNSVGTRAYNNFYVLDQSTGLEFDVLRNGELSCASFVSSILTIYGLIDCPHATAETVIASLTPDLGWRETMDITPGNVILWENITYPDGTPNEHIGFILNDTEAVSTSSTKRQVTKHHITYGTNDQGSPVRKISKIYTNLNI